MDVVALFVAFMSGLREFKIHSDIHWSDCVVNAYYFLNTLKYLETPKICESPLELKMCSLLIGSLRFARQFGHHLLPR